MNLGRVKNDGRLVIHSERGGMYVRSREKSFILYYIHSVSPFLPMEVIYRTGNAERCDKNRQICLTLRNQFNFKNATIRHKN